jgi:hypothetical protein
MTFSDTISLISIALQATFAIIGVVLTITVARASRRFAQAQYAQTLAAAWNNVNSMVTSSEEILRIADGLYYPGNIHDSIEVIRRRWVIFIELTILEAIFLGLKDKMIDSEYGKKTLEDILHPILVNDDVFKIATTRGYHPRFAEYCLNERNKILRDNDKLLRYFINN